MCARVCVCVCVCRQPRNLSEGSLVLSLQAGSSCNVDCNDIQVIAGELVGHAILMEVSGGELAA